MIAGETHKICDVTNDMKAFRLESEKYGVVHDYDERHIQAATVLTVSLNDGKTWIDIPFIES